MRFHPASWKSPDPDLLVLAMLAMAVGLEGAVAFESEIVLRTSDPMQVRGLQANLCSFKQPLRNPS